jgi:hypothetical protein
MVWPSVSTQNVPKVFENEDQITKYHHAKAKKLLRDMYSDRVRHDQYSANRQASNVKSRKKSNPKQSATKLSKDKFIRLPNKYSNDEM